MANYVLEILDGDRAGEVLPVGDTTIRIGRKSGNDIVLADEKTSGVHCEIQPEGDRLVLKDLGSTNGTFLDGRRLTELVLTPGDVVTVGRIRVKFRPDGEATDEVDAGEFAMRKLDAGRVGKRGGSIGLLLALLLVAGGAGGWYWWQGQQQQSGNATGSQKERVILKVSGNRVAVEVANCEQEEGWSLRAAGVGFRSGGASFTGSSGFAAYYDAAEDGEGAVTAANSVADFAVMELAEPLDVFAGRTMTVAAHLRTTGGAQVALHAKVFASSEEVPFRFATGSKMEAHDEEWQRVEATVTVPAGCDRLTVEVVAVLPNQESEAMVDDVAVTEDGSANGIELALTGAGQTAFGVASALAVRSADVQNPATVLRIVPDEVPAAMAGLHKAGYCTLSDLGASLECSQDGSDLVFAATGVDSLQFVMPAEAAGGVSVLDTGKFQAAAAQSEFATEKVLFGSFTTRAMLEVEAVTQMRGDLGNGLYRLSVASPKATLVLGFRSERQQAGQLVREAAAAKAEGQPGRALDIISKLFATVPMDSDELANAEKLRGRLLIEQAARLAQLRKDLDDAVVFNTRGGFERVVSGVSELLDLYGEQNVEDLAGTQGLRGKALERLITFDRAGHKVQRARLTMLADAFGAEKPTLRKIVTDYIVKYLPMEPGEQPDGNDEGSGDGK
jgi:hypothetical protein